MIIDFHVHCFPEKIVQRAVAELSNKAGIPPKVDGSICGIKDSMRKAGIDKCVILSIATKPSQTINVNNWAAEKEDDSITCFGSIHPDFEGWKEELKRVKDLGLKGIKLHPDYQQFFVDEKRLFPIYEEAFNLGMTVIFHAGIDIGLPAPYHCTPERLSNVLDHFEGGKIVAAHMGGYDYWDDVEKFLVGRDIYLDTSYSLELIKDEQMKRIVKNHGYKKILFGTDSPWADQGEEISKIKQLGFDSHVEDAILGLNAKELLNI